MDDRNGLATRFAAHRDRLHAVAYRMLGSVSEADDAVQEAWLRLSRTGAGDIDDLGAWLTTVTARVCLDMLRSRAARREEPLDVDVREPIIRPDDGAGPEDEALLADAVGQALLVTLETLTPAERLAFVLHDIFAVPFVEIAPIIERSPTAARQLASRARRRVRARSTPPDAGQTRQREVVDAFQAAARDGDFDALVELLDPDVVLRAERGATDRPGRVELRGASRVARQALGYAELAGAAHPALVDGHPGFVVAPDGRPTAVLGFVVDDGRIIQIDVFSDPDLLGRLDLRAFGHSAGR